MAVVATLDVTLGARTSKFSKGMKSATKDLSLFQRGASAVGGKLLGFTAAIGGAVAGILTLRAGIRGVSNAFSELDGIAKTSDKLGIATEELTGLRHAAALTAGMATGALDTALQRMTRRISEAAHGSGEAAGAIRELGLDAGALAAAGPTRAFGMIADAMQGVESQADRVRLAFKLFDTEGVGLVNTLRGGSEGLLAFQKEAEKLGIAVNRVDLAQIEAANDAMARMGALFTGVFRRIAVEVAPILEAIVTHFVSIGTASEGMAGTVRGAIDFVLGGIAGFLDGLDALRTAWAALQVGAQVALSAIVEGVALLAKSIEIVAEALTTGFVSAFAQAQQVIAEGIAALIAMFAGFATWIESKLPERFRTGIGAAAEEFSAAFGDSVEQARKNLNDRDFGIDFKFGENTESFSDALAEDTKKAMSEFETFASRETFGAKFLKGIESIREKSAKAAESAIADTGAAEEVASVGEKLKPAAFERGSQEAFAAFQKASSPTKTIEEEQLAEQKKAAKSLAQILSTGLVLSAAKF